MDLAGEGTCWCVVGGCVELEWEGVLEEREEGRGEVGKEWGIGGWWSV